MLGIKSIEKIISVQIERHSHMEISLWEVPNYSKAAVNSFS